MMQETFKAKKGKIGHSSSYVLIPKDIADKMEVGKHYNIEIKEVEINGTSANS
jgi:hypothetical protein